MECRNCSGNQFTKTKTGNYRCSYCGTFYYEEKSPRAAAPVTSPALKKILLISGALVIAFTASLLLFIAGGEKSETAHKPAKTFTYRNKNKLPEPAGKIIKTDTIKDSIGNIYFILIVENTGKTGLKKPMVTVRLFSKDNKKIASGRGYAFKDKLNPGEKTPVSVLITDYPSYARAETEYIPELPYVLPESGIFEKTFKAEITGVTLKRTGIGNGHRVKGSIKNTSKHTVSYAHVGAVLYNNKDKVIGYGTGYTGEKILKPGEGDFFSIYMSSVNGTPEYYTLFYDGLVK